MSILRIIGVILGLSMLGICFFRLRYHADKRTDVWLLSAFGISIVFIGLFPGIVNFPAELLSFRDHKMGRIITLLIILTTFLCFCYIYERSKAQQRHFQFDTLVRNLAVQDFLRNHEQEINFESIIVIIPAYNEVENLNVVLPRIPKQIEGIRVTVLVVDDGSTDETYNISRKFGGFVATHHTNRGGGAALKTGYSIVKRLMPSVIVTMDGDGQHDPEEICVIVKPLIEEKADFIIGSRVLGTSEQYSFFRTFGVTFFSKLINIIIGTEITDCSSGFRAFKKDILKDCVLLQEQYHTAEIIIEAAKRGFRIQEMPVNIHRRFSGKSKKGADIKYGLLFLRTIIKAWWR